MLELLTEVRKTLTFTSFSKDLINYTDEQPDEKMHRTQGEDWEGPKYWSFCPCGVGVGQRPGM